MNASPRVLDAAHIIDETPHFWQRERFIGLHRATTCVHKGDVVLFRLNRFERSAIKRQVLKQIDEEGLDLVASEELRRGRQHPGPLFV